MKQFFVLLISSFAVTAAFSQTLFTYGANAVSKEEFLRAYNKNKTPVADKEKAFREYLELYLKFKLKVKAAAELRLDTLQQLKYDVQNFRSQVEESYLNDEKEVNRLVDEVFERSQKDIHLLYCYVPIGNEAGAADTTKAHKAIEQLREQLVKGSNDYEAAAKRSSAEFSNIQVKDLGFITALTLNYDNENTVYALKPGEISGIKRSKSALYFFKNIEERKSPGKWKTAQILFALPPDVTAEKKKEMANLADSVYNLLQKGADFAAMAKKYSDDRITYLNGGEMGEFGTGKFEMAFENAVFALKKDGEISRPVFTGYGFHIIKRLQQKPTPTDRTDEAYLAGLKQQVLQDARINIAKENFLKAVLKRTGFKRNPAVKDEQLFRLADTVTASKTVKAVPAGKTTVFSFTKSKVTGSDWMNFVKDYKLNTDVYKGEDNKALLEKYINTAALEYYRKHLEEFNDDFKYQMQEFKEGNMLFEIMERNVWSKAAADTDGLKKFYAVNKEQYKWNESAAVLLFSCNSVASAREAIDSLRSGKNWKLVADESEGRVQADSGRYEIAQLQLPAGVSAAPGLIGEPQVNSNDNTASFVKILELFPGNQQRSFEEARGLVINEYQNHLEEKWLAELKKKYPVKINEAVLQSLWK